MKIASYTFTISVSKRHTHARPKFQAVRCYHFRGCCRQPVAMLLMKGLGIIRAVCYCDVCLLFEPVWAGMALITAHNSLSEEIGTHENSDLSPNLELLWML